MGLSPAALVAGDRQAEPAELQKPPTLYTAPCIALTSCLCVCMAMALAKMPHFLALAWMCKDDYRRGGFRMLPGFDPKGRRTAGVALRHIALLLPLGAVAAALQVRTLTEGQGRPERGIDLNHHTDSVATHHFTAIHPVVVAQKLGKGCVRGPEQLGG